MAYGYISFLNKDADYNSTTEWSDELNIKLKSVLGEDTITDFDNIWEQIAKENNLTYGPSLQGWCNISKEASSEWIGEIKDINNFFKEFLSNSVTKQVFSTLRDYNWTISEPFISEQCRFITNTDNIIDWTSVIEKIKDVTGQFDIHNEELSDKSLPVIEYESLAKKRLHGQIDKYIEQTKDKRTSKRNRELKEQAYKTFQSWIDAGIMLSNISWEDFFPDIHFDKSIEQKFAEIVGVTPIPGRTFVTRVAPGKTAPWHWDMLPDVSTYKEKGKLFRYVAFMHDPIPAQTLSFEKQTFWNPKKGEIYQWKDVNDMHAAANSSIEPYYLFHMIGYK